MMRKGIASVIPNDNGNITVRVEYIGWEISITMALLPNKPNLHYYKNVFLREVRKNNNKWNFTEVEFMQMSKILIEALQKTIKYE